MKKLFSTGAVFAMAVFYSSSLAQSPVNVGINYTGASADGSALLDVSGSNKGVLIPRIALTGVNDASTVASPAASLLVYNLGSGGLSPAGYYFNSGTSGSPVWTQFLTGGSGGTGWLTTGNAGTSPASNFIGTKDGQDFRIRTNNLERVSILQSNGYVGIGILSPTALLHLKISGGASVYNFKVEDSNQDGGLKIGTESTSASIQSYRVSNSATDKLLLNPNGGNVGIGTTSPLGLLSIHAASSDPVSWFTRGDNVASNTVTLRLGTNNSTYKNYSAYVQAVQGAGIDRWALGFGTGSAATATTKMYIDEWGNVGIGTTSPATLFHTKSAASTDNEVRIDVTSGSNKSILGLANAGTDYGQLFFDNSTNNLVLYHKYSAGDLLLGTNSSTKVTIKNGGNVGIGTTSPAQKLEVAGAIRTTGATGAGNLYLFDDNSYGYIVGGSTLTNAPSVHLSNPTRSGYEGGHLSLSAGYHASSGTTTSQHITFLTSNLERMRIARDGNVGIGITNPSSKLDVASSTNSAWAMQIANTGSTDAHGLYVNIGSSSTGVPFRVDKNGTGLFQISNNGNVGIGTTSPDYKLHIKDGSSGEQLKLQRGTGVVTFKQDNNLNNLYIDAEADIYLNANGGDVGIGVTSNGSYRFKVNGQPAANGYTAFTNYSDSRLKKDVSDVENCLDKIMQLRPVQFKYNQTYQILYNDSTMLNRVQKGFIAQEVMNIFPEMVGTEKIKDNNNIEQEYYDMNLSNLQVYMVKAIQEQQAIINDLLARLKALEK